MDAVFIKLIEQLNSSVAVLIVVLCLVIWLTFKAGRILEKFDHHETKLDEARGIRDEMISIRTKVDLIYQNTNPNALFRSQSPLALTPKGHEAASSLSATETLDKLYGDLHAAVESENPETAYDIQVAALKVARSLLPSHLTAMELVKIKDYAFKNGALLDDMLTMFGLLLRDRVLSERGIPLTDVDKSEPKNAK